MGRRALRKLDPSLDLEYHLKKVDQLPRPWDAESLFGRVAPLEVEIGSGKGLFMRTEAEARPDTNFLGIEIAKKYAAHCAAGLAKHELTNGVMVHGDASIVLREVLPEGQIDAFHVYFPDPWWKERHRRRRILRTDVILEMQRLLRPGGELQFWTDVQEYFETTLELFKTEPLIQFEPPMDVNQRAPEHDLDYRTHFERRTRLHEEPVYRVIFKKPA
jgi:tRNA (guanine-N7-)-methyltransferase